MSTRSLSRSSFPSVFDDFFKPWNQWFDENGGNARTTLPAVNVAENKTQYSVKLAVPGMDKKDFRIDVEGRMLTISAEKETKSEKEDEKYSRREYNYTSFSRSFTLPEDVEEEAIRASYSNGELIISLPRKKGGEQQSGTKQIAVS